jgi:hypothetical protein
LEFTFHDLTTEVRKHMLSELTLDESSGTLYFSTRFTDVCRLNYPGLLRQALGEGTPTTLSQALLVPDYFLEQEPYTRQGKTYFRRIPSNAHLVVAEGEFNRFYIRGVCLRSIELDINQVLVYRAKPVEAPRPDSELKIGAVLSAETLLKDLRANIGVDTALGLPSGPSSGLSIRIPRS